MAVAQLPPQGCPASGPPPNSDRGGGSAALQVDGDFQFQNNPGGVIFPGANQPRVRMPTGLTGLGTCVDPPRLGRVWAGNPPAGLMGWGPKI